MSLTGAFRCPTQASVVVVVVVVCVHHFFLFFDSLLNALSSLFDIGDEVNVGITSNIKFPLIGDQVGDNQESSGNETDNSKSAQAKEDDADTEKMEIANGLCNSRTRLFHHCARLFVEEENNNRARVTGLWDSAMEARNEIVTKGKRSKKKPNFCLLEEMFEDVFKKMNEGNVKVMNAFKCIINDDILPIMSFLEGSAFTQKSIFVFLKIFKKKENVSFTSQKVVKEVQTLFKSVHKDLFKAMADQCVRTDHDPKTRFRSHGNRKVKVTLCVQQHLSKSLATLLTQKGFDWVGDAEEDVTVKVRKWLVLLEGTSTTIKLVHISLHILLKRERFQEIWKKLTKAYTEALFPPKKDEKNIQTILNHELENIGLEEMCKQVVKDLSTNEFQAKKKSMSVDFFCKNMNHLGGMTKTEHKAALKKEERAAEKRAPEGTTAQEDEDQKGKQQQNGPKENKAHAAEEEEGEAKKSEGEEEDDDESTASHKNPHVDDEASSAGTAKDDVSQNDEQKDHFAQEKASEKQKIQEECDADDQNKEQKKNFVLEAASGKQQDQGGSAADNQKEEQNDCGKQKNQNGHDADSLWEQLAAFSLTNGFSLAHFATDENGSLVHANQGFAGDYDTDISKVNVKITLVTPSMSTESESVPEDMDELRERRIMLLTGKGECPYLIFSGQDVSHYDGVFWLLTDLKTLDKVGTIKMCMQSGEVTQQTQTSMFGR